MTLAAGDRVGPYEVIGPLGTGGMGEVYRASDPRLKREVAIKVLPAAFTSDPERLARFEREARMLATLNHPNIGTIHGVEESEGTRALVLELVEGETLFERIARGSLPMAEVLAIARQIADGLDAAHERGMVHRDLKPANIKITPAGVVKILDFGLAKMAPDLNPTDSLASTRPRESGPEDTRESVIMGTAAYMSPEQARGLPVDKRTDIWAFGCVLFEMLTGRRAFGGKTFSDALVTILEREPDFPALPGATPPAVRRLLRRSLEKDARRRLRDIADARHELDDSTSASEPQPLAGAGPWPRAIHAATIVAAVAGGAVLSWLWFTGRERTAPAVSRTTITMPFGQSLDVSPGSRPLAISADGRRVVYAAGREVITQLYVREIDAFEPVALVGTEGAHNPFFSPDGRTVAFFADGLLKRIPVEGGTPLPICDAPGGKAGRGGTWGPDGTIVFAPGPAGLMRVSAAGGMPMPIQSRDKTMDARRFSWPEFLPDGRGLLATVSAWTPGAEMVFLSLDTGEWRMLGPGEQPSYVSDGYLVFHAPLVREGTMRAVAFDLVNGAVRGESISLLDGLFRAPGGGGLYYAVSRSGTLVFAPGGLTHTLVKADRNGRLSHLSDDRLGFRTPRVSPDGRRVAVTIDPRPSGVWVYDIERHSRILLASGGHNYGPVWARDGRRIAYVAPGGIVVRAADGSGAAEQAADFGYPTDWTRDGRLVVGTLDIGLVVLGKSWQPVIATPFAEGVARLSPDEKWIAYQSDESGRVEVYLRPFPSTGDAKWIVSNGGGHSPVWSPNGREIFYMVGTTLMAAPLSPHGRDPAVGSSVALFSGPFDTPHGNFDVFPDGSGFVMVEVDPDTQPTRLNVVLNWLEVLKAKKAAER